MIPRPRTLDHPGELHRVVAPIVADLLSVLWEFSSNPEKEDFDALLLRRYRAAGQRRDPEALRRVCEEIKREACARMLARETGRAA